MLQHRKGVDFTPFSRLLEVGRFRSPTVRVEEALDRIVDRTIESSTGERPLGLTGQCRADIDRSRRRDSPDGETSRRPPTVSPA